MKNNIPKNSPNTSGFLKKMLVLGLSGELPPYLYGQGYVFNVLNIAGFLLAFLRFIYIALISPYNYSLFLITINFLPVAVCAVMMFLMYKRAYKTTVYFSFLVFPVLLLCIGLYSHDRGVLLYLMPYMVYPFFFLNSKRKIVPTFLSITFIFIIGLVYEVYRYEKNGNAKYDMVLEIISFSGAIFLTFISLFSIKFQVWSYQEKTRQQRKELQEKNDEIEIQKQKLEESNQIKDKLFSIIGHDMKAPLQGLYLLLETEDNMEEASKLLIEVLPDLKAELKKTSDLFENLINWAKLQLQESYVSNEQISIAEITGKVTESLSKKAGEKRVTLHAEPCDFYINADKAILEIVLRNLVSNAIKFSSAKDIITISGNRHDKNIEIKVCDTGVGINEETLRKIQSKTFYTSNGTKNEKGTGLGLIICKDLVEKCGGTLTIESMKDVGTTVSICLPQ